VAVETPCTLVTSADVLDAPVDFAVFLAVLVTPVGIPAVAVNVVAFATLVTSSSKPEVAMATEVLLEVVIFAGTPFVIELSAVVISTDTTGVAVLAMVTVVDFTGVDAVLSVAVVIFSVLSSVGCVAADGNLVSPAAIVLLSG